MSKYIKIAPGLLRTEYSAYSDSGAANKNELHTKGKTFLKAIANQLGLSAQDYDLRSNKAGVAVSGEVTLHSDQLYVQISESFMRPGLQILYRTCSGRRDCVGHQNNFVNMRDLVDEYAQESFINRLAEMQARASGAAPSY